MTGFVTRSHIASESTTAGLGTATERISIVIPTLNEADYLERTLAAVAQARNYEVIVVDGGSRDKTEALAAARANRVLQCTGGRARQMNAGAAAARGNILLFLHADTCLPRQFDRHIRALLKNSHVALGAFRLRIDDPRRSLRVIQWSANLRARYLGLPYGDQALFLRTTTFRRVRGFRELPIMEDFDFVRRLKSSGRIVVLPQEATTSARRWRALGPWRTTLMNQAIVLGYHCGISPDTLARWYSRSTDS